ncbi:chain-length determining protein [Pseudomonas yamanorum]|uniref:Wzz/FepE/Etk N-terminal domain-containing protein n=1 Tax=Pseudomonas yamanorum TaxID=515393 RepID=UPI001C44BAD3|nr:chain-length determining protein [Pseudomonas yamanorum]
MTSSFRAPSIHEIDQFDIVAIFKALWNQKKLIASVVVVGILGGLGYSMMVTPEYQVSSTLRPAALNELDALNRSEIYVLPPYEALKKLGASLESYETRLEFFKAHQKLFKAFVKPGQTLEQSFEEFNSNSISVMLPDPEKMDSLSTYIKLQLNYPGNVEGVSILNGLVDYAIQKERQKISADVSVIVSNRLNELSGKFSSARADYQADKEAKVASLLEADNIKRAQLNDELLALRAQLRVERSNRVVELNEAISVARRLGIKKPSTPSSLAESAGSGGAYVMHTEVNNQQFPLYFMGVDALEAERTALLARKSDDFTTSRISQIAKELQLLKSNREIEVLAQRENEDIFLSGVQPLRAEISRLRNINTNMNQLKLVAVDKQALGPLKPVKPQRLLSIVLGAVIGAMLGITIALMRYAARPRN